MSVRFVSLLLLPLLFAVSGCQVPLGDATNRYFVDGTNGSDANEGIRARPLKTIAEGLNRAAQTGGEVIVAEGTYAEAVEMRSAVELRGGFDPERWVQNPRQHTSVILIEDFSSADFPVMCWDVTTAMLQGFTIVAPDVVESDVFADSSIALSIHDSMDVTIDDNVLMAGRGGDANDIDGRRPTRAAGDDGDDGEGAAACTGFSQRREGGAGGSGGPGTNGGRGGDGAATNRNRDDPRGGEDGGGGPGVGGFGGIAPSGDGTIGLNYANASPAGPGDGGPGYGSVSRGYYQRSEAPDGQGGNPGGGGGGGAGGPEALGTVCGGGGGGGGEGGAGGTGGVGGFGAGASIGIVITESTDIRITGNRIETVGGGNGANGELGGFGGDGGRGGEGGGSLVGNGGGDGGPGGKGQTGGRGGGGGGGPSVGIAEDESSVVDASRNRFDLGPGGAGGALARPGEPGIEERHVKGAPE